MWIAKNSITGKTYGKKYESIYDCQCFIDKELFHLEIEMRRCFSLEEAILDKLKCEKEGMSILESLYYNIRKGIESLEKGVNPYFKVISNSIIDSDYENALKQLNNIYLKDWHKNNVIRCWNIDQKRFADGFDF